MTGLIADSLQFKDSFGIAWTIALLLALVVAYLLYIHFKNKAESLKERTSKSEETLELLRKSILLDSGQSVSIVSLVELMAGLSDNFTKNCAGCIEHRREVRDVGAVIETIQRDVETFVVEGRQSRQVTQDVINNISVRLDKLSSEIIATLRLGLGLKTKKNLEGED